MSNQEHLYTIEETTNNAYDIFLQLAPENLSEQDILDFNQYHEECGFIEESDADESWQEFTEFEIEPELYIQVLVGLEFDNQDVIFAKILISRDKAAPFVHVIWK